MTDQSDIHFAIIGIQVEINKGRIFLQEMTKELTPFLTIVKFSNLYKREKKSLDKERYELVGAFKISTNLNLFQLTEVLRGLKSKMNLSLLVYDKVVNVVPEYTVPNPILIDDYPLLKCASEIWPHYEHPIMKKNLIEICDSNRSHDSLDFYLQGKDIFEESL